MNALQDRRILALVGAGAALLAGVLIAIFFMAKGEPPVETANTTTPTGLTVEMSADVLRLDPTRPLRCFVGGQFIGMATLADCAQRNGVAAQSLDVGLDESGELAAGGELAPLQPLDLSPPQVATTATPPALPPLQTTAPSPVEAAAPVSECLSYGGDGWRSLGGAMSRNACVQILFDGRCVRGGDALYGRWGVQTLRLVPGAVETSNDNRSFSSLVAQGPNCTLSGL